jgi:hypothetical protein
MSMVLSAVVAGCAPSPSLQAELLYSAAYRGPYVVVSGRHLSPMMLYKVGVNTIWSPQFVGLVQSDAAGNVVSQPFFFSCSYIITPPINVGLYSQDGLAMAQTTIDAMPCTP